MRQAHLLSQLLTRIIDAFSLYPDWHLQNWQAYQVAKGDSLDLLSTIISLYCIGIYFLLLYRMKSHSALLPSLDRNFTATDSLHTLLPKPSLHRIRYPPLSDVRTKENHQNIMLQSCVTNVTSKLKQKLYDDIVDQRRQLQLARQLQPSQEGSRRVIDALPSVIGKEAPIQYYSQYKTLDKALLKRDLNSLVQNSSEIKIESPTVSLLQKAESLMVLPLCLGLVKSKGEASILNISDYNLGDRYIIALAAGLKKARMIEKMYLSGNRITDLSLAELAPSINSEVTVLELARNKITVLDKRIVEMIIEASSRLEWLGLANNYLRESSATAIFLNARYSKHLMRLDLRFNKLGLGCLQALTDLIQKTSTLEELYIGGNYLSGRSGESVFKALGHNKTLRVFDYSLNQLGDDSGLNAAQAIVSCLQINQTLQHLDLSFNNFSKEVSEVIANGLASNRTLYGFHFRGNYGYVNARGFLVLAERQGTQLHSIDSFRMDGFNVTVPLLQNSIESHNYHDACWICQGWYEQQFKLSLPKTSENMLVYIHFDFEKYEPRLIAVSQQVRYVTMVPPRKYRFFYTVNDQVYIDEHIQKETLSFSETHTYQMNHLMKTFKVQIVNWRTGKPKKIVNEWRNIIIKTVPRGDGLTIKKEKDPWTFQKSVWAKEWKLQNEDLLRKCFQKDWKCSKLPNLVKNQADKDKVKELLWKGYSSIKNLYKYFSSWNPFGDIWAVSSNPFTQFCQQARIINKDTPLKIIDLTFITTNSMSSANYKGNQMVPERGLVRFQFMEALVRLAQQKYKKLNLTDNFADATDQILNEHILSLAKNYNMQQWRSDHYFNEFNDALIKKFRLVFATLFKKNSRLKVRPGEKPYMCLAEFKSIFERIGLGTTLTERDIFIAFNNSMMTQVDELQNDRFMRMSEIEFIEGVARCAFCLPGHYTLKEVDSAPLHLKFQWMIQQLLSVCPEQTRAQLPEMQQSMFQIQELQE